MKCITLVASWRFDLLSQLINCLRHALLTSETLLVLCLGLWRAYLPVRSIFLVFFIIITEHAILRSLGQLQRLLIDDGFHRFPGALKVG